MKEAKLISGVLFFAIYGGLLFWAGRSSSPSGQSRDSVAAEGAARQRSAHLEGDAIAKSDEASPLARRLQKYRRLSSAEFTAEIGRLHSAPLADQVLSHPALFEAWAAIDPKEALRAARSLNVGKEEAIALVLAIWCESDPAAAADFYKQNEKGLFFYDTLSPWRQISGAEVLAKALAQKSPQEALAWAQQLGHVQDQAQAVRALVHHLVEHNPEAARTFFHALEPGGHRDRALETLAKNWARQDPKAAIDWLNDELDEFEREVAIDFLVTGMARGNPQLASEYLQYLPGNRDSAIRAITEGWSETSPKEAGDWLVSTMDAEEHRHFLPLVFEKWLPQGTEPVKDWIRNQPDPATREESIIAYVRATASGLEKTPELLKFVKQEVKDKRRYDLALSEVIVAWSRRDRDAAIEYANESNVSDATMADILHRSSAQQPLDDEP